MIYDLEVGDLVTAKLSANARGTRISGSINVRRPVEKSWDLWLPRHSIMTIIKITIPSFHGIQTIATVLHDGELFEVFLDDVELLNGVNP